MTEAPERTALYRIRDEDGALLYIGITKSVPHRWNGHMRVQPWWDDLRSLTVEWHDTRDEAEAAEEAAIKAELPKYNVTYLRPPRRRMEAVPIVPVEVKLEPRADDDNLLTLFEAANMARLRPGDLGGMVEKGNGPEGFLLGKQRVFRRREIREWIAAVEASQQGAA